MTPSTLVPAIQPAPTLPAQLQEEARPEPRRRRVTLNIRVEDARAFEQFLRSGDLGDYNAPARVAVGKIRRKLFEQLAQFPA